MTLCILLVVNCLGESLNALYLLGDVLVQHVFRSLNQVSNVIKSMAADTLLILKLLIHFISDIEDLSIESLVCLQIFLSKFLVELAALQYEILT